MLSTKLPFSKKEIAVVSRTKRKAILLIMSTTHQAGPLLSSPSQDKEKLPLWCQALLPFLVVTTIHS